MVAGEDAARVACSPLAWRRAPGCVNEPQGPYATTTVVVPADATRAPFAFWFALENSTRDVSPSLADASLVEVDGDEARELAVRVRSHTPGEGRREHLIIVDDDGRPLFETVLVECTAGNEYGDSECETSYATLADTDGDGRVELEVIHGAESDAQMRELLHRSLDRTASGNPSASDEPDDPSSALDAISVTTYRYDPRSGRFVALARGAQ